MERSKSTSSKYLLAFSYLEGSRFGLLADMHRRLHAIVTTIGICQQIHSAVLGFLYADRQTTDMAKLIGDLFSSKFRVETVNIYVVMAISSGLTCVPYFVKIGHLVQKLKMGHRVP